MRSFLKSFLGSDFTVPTLSLVVPKYQLLTFVYWDEYVGSV